MEIDLRGDIFVAIRKVTDRIEEGLRNDIDKMIKAGLSYQQPKFYKRGEGYGKKY